MSDTQKNHRTAAVPMAYYANYFDIGHNAYEFLVDFGQYQPETSEVALHTRIVFGPTYAKLLADLFLKAIRQYETEHGPIPELDEKSVNPLEVIHSSLPDFERRALGVRRVAAASSLANTNQQEKKR